MLIKIDNDYVNPDHIVTVTGDDDNTYVTLSTGDVLTPRLSLDEVVTIVKLTTWKGL